MSSDTQSSHPLSPGKDSTHSIRGHSSPSPVVSTAIASGTLPDANKSRTRSVAAILRDASSPLDRNSCIIAPFDDEVRRDAEFYQNLKDKQIEIIALMNSWVFSRLIAENERAGESLSREMDTVAEAEREQGMSPLDVPPLSVFLTRFLALALGARADNFFSLTGVAERMRIQLENCVSNIKAALTALSRAKFDYYANFDDTVLDNLFVHVFPLPTPLDTRDMGVNSHHCSFVLLAEFDIDRGAQLTYQFPQPLGTDEGLLANLMLPDGAEKHLEDWTIFFLNQTPFNMIEPVLALETPDSPGKEDKLELLYVLNLVRTKHDKSVRRGAVVKAMAICTPHPFIQIFKPVLLLALDDYFSAPSQDCLARLFDAINSMDLSAAPILTRSEKIIMRNSERKDVFIEKFTSPRASETPQHLKGRGNHKPMNSTGSHSSFDEGIMMRTKDSMEGRGRASSDTSTRVPSLSHHNGAQHSPSEASSFTLGGSAVWVGEEGTLVEHAASNGVPSSYGSHGSSIAAKGGRRSTDASSSSSHGPHPRPPINAGTSDPRLGTKDTHFYHTTIDYKGHQLPIKMPLFTFPQEVGDYSLIQLIQIFSSATTTGPLHPHLHSNGSLTHPIILLFNALVTGKRIIFLGHNRPAGQVSSYVLSACALGSGCGIILRGFIERAFPYANLTNREEWESVPAYIAGVTNPIFESTGSWDLLCDVASGRMIVSKDIHASHPPSGTQVQAGPPSILTRSGTLKAESSIGSEDDLGRLPGREKEAQKSDFTAKADNADNVFIEDIISAINFHFGESLVRARFVEYVWRFVRLASRYEEDLVGTTTIGYPGASFNEGPGDTSRLGSGMVFLDDVAGTRELTANASRIEGWRRTPMYRVFQEDFKHSRATNAIRGLDVHYQLWRLRTVKHMQDAEVELIMRTLVNAVQTYDQVVELLALTPPYTGGLLPLSFGLFHQQEVVRDLTVDLFTQLRMFPVGVQFLQALNHFQRYAYVRQAHARESRGSSVRDPSGAGMLAPPAVFSRTPSHRSELNLSAG